jgi:hypothetical protein
MGCTETLLHDSFTKTGAKSIPSRAANEFGAQHVKFLEDLSAKNTDNSISHWIPPEESHTVAMGDIQATHVWCSGTWTPVPARSLGFSIGPFRVLEDPEYFEAAAEAEVDDDEKGPDELIETARLSGEGIRQAYFCPVFARKFIHRDASRVLLPETQLVLADLSSRQREILNRLDQSVLSTTVGVPHRALSLMRDVLALPTYRTASYTQIWIPNALHGGVTSGSFHFCPEVLVNPFLGGAVLDSRMLPPTGSRLPFYQGGRVLQCLQARCAIRGWIVASLPLGGKDDVGGGYIFALAESLLMSLYERGNGAHGEGGGKGGVFFSNRYSLGSGLNSSNLDFLPVQNIEDMDVVISGVGAVPVVDDRQNDQLWRSATNGSESHTSSTDEFNVRQLLCRDAVEALERGTDKDKAVPSPSMGWFGSHLSLSFLSSNAASSSDLGCGGVELLHPIGGLVYRALKCEVFRGIVEGRAGIANFVRLIRASFIAAHLEDLGESELKLPKKREKEVKDTNSSVEKDEVAPKAPFVVCVNEILKKKGLSHTLFTRALQNLSGRAKEPHLLGTLVDVERHAEDPRTRRPFVEPEGFPNSFVRGASLLYCRVGVQVEQARDSTGTQGPTVGKGIQMQAYAEPVIPEGGLAFSGPITVRVIENEGQFREYVKDIVADGSRRDWGTTFLHAKPVTTVKAQTAASGTIEASSRTSKEGSKSLGSVSSSIFTDSFFHSGGYQAIELIRLTNLSPLLWVRVDPMGLYAGRISVCQPDACLAEQLFHDGDAAAQVEAIRTLAERPIRIQPSSKVNAVYDVSVMELPVRVLGDCLRGSPALHSSLPHTPAIRSQAALAIAQWQNNKAPPSKDSVDADSWIGINLLLHYFRERFYSNSIIMPTKFSRLALKKSDVEMNQAAAANESAGANQPTFDDAYEYLDILEAGEERAAALEDADQVEIEEDEEYRVRSAVVTAIACTRAKDGLTPSIAVEFLETVLEAEDASVVGHLIYPDEELMIEKNFRTKKYKTELNADDIEVSTSNYISTPSLSFVSSAMIADALLAMCHINASPTVYTDPATGEKVVSSGPHPVSKLIKIAREWLDWENYRESIRNELAMEDRSGISGNCYDNIAACAVTALSTLAILRQSTTEDERTVSSRNIGNGEKNSERKTEDIATAKFYVAMFDEHPVHNDPTRAACAQAMSCICCATDRFEDEKKPPLGLLSALEFLLDRVLDDEVSPCLKQTLCLIMMDACTGKVSSMQRVGVIGGRNDLFVTAARYFNGPLGASQGNDNGSALLTSVSPSSSPAASAVNDGARRGLRLLSRAGHPREALGEEIVVRVARFATRLWRTINGEPAEALTSGIVRLGPSLGVCAYDGALRCTLLSLWQWIWPRGCFAVLQVQAWKAHEGTDRYFGLGAHHVMKITEDEKVAATEEEEALSELNKIVSTELDRQAWRGEMSRKAYDIYKSSKGTVHDVGASEQGIGQPLPPIQRDAAFKQGGWVSSAAQQRRALALDGGTAVTKLRLTVKSG